MFNAYKINSISQTIPDFIDIKKDPNYWMVAITAFLDAKVYGVKEKITYSDVNWHRDHVAILI